MQVKQCGGVNYSLKLSAGMKCRNCWSRDELSLHTIFRLAGAHQHPSITGLIRTAGELYAAEGRSQDFIIDLLKMNTKSSVMPENNGSDDIQLTSDLTKVLHDYIEMNALESVLSVIISKVHAYLVGIGCRNMYTYNFIPLELYK